MAKALEKGGGKESGKNNILSALASAWRSVTQIGWNQSDGKVSYGGRHQLAQAQAATEVDQTLHATNESRQIARNCPNAATPDQRERYKCGKKGHKRIGCAAVSRHVAQKVVRPLETAPRNSCPEIHPRKVILQNLFQEIRAWNFVRSHAVAQPGWLGRLHWVRDEGSGLGLVFRGYG